MDIHSSKNNPTLCLHVGYGKTGSTAIQHWLACQYQQLEHAGIIYPIPEQGLGDSGNGLMLWDAMEEDNCQPAWQVQGLNDAHVYLFSREHFAREFSESDRCQALASWASRCGFSSVRVLLFVRDPRQHCYSLWAQKVKRAGETRSLRSFAKDYDGIKMASRFLEEAMRAAFDVSVLNYDCHRNSLMSSFNDWLSDVIILAGQDILRLPISNNQKMLNLTPNPSQLRLKRLLNDIWKKTNAVGQPPLPPKQLADFIYRLKGDEQLPEFEESLVKQWAKQVDQFNLICKENGILSGPIVLG